MDEVDPADNITIVASNNGKAREDDTATTDEWTDEENTDDENVLWEQSVPIIDDENSQGPRRFFLAGVPASRNGHLGVRRNFL